MIFPVLKKRFVNRWDCEGVKLENDVLPSKIYIELYELPTKHRKAVGAIVKELGFSLDEISELVIVITHESTDRAGVEDQKNSKEG